jgi:hypothetical protein
MVSSKTIALLLSFAISATALVTPHDIQNAHRRHALTPRIPAPDPAAVVDGAAFPQVVRKRTLGKRCKQRPAPSASSTSKHQTPTPSPSSPPPPPPPAPPANAGANPDKPPASPTIQETHTRTQSAPQSTANLPSYMVGTQHGQGTFYSTGLGACGITNNDGQHICAVSHDLFDSFPGYNGANPNNNPICGRQVTASYQGKSVTLTITDRCEGCKVTDLDMSPSAFNSVADPTLGRIDITWHWN